MSLTGIEGGTEGPPKSNDDSGVWKTTLGVGRNKLKAAKTETWRDREKGKHWGRTTKKRYFWNASLGCCNKLPLLQKEKHSYTSQPYQLYSPMYWMYWSTSCHDNEQLTQVTDIQRFKFKGECLHQAELPSSVAETHRWREWTSTKLGQRDKEHAGLSQSPLRHVPVAYVHKFPPLKCLHTSQ